MLLPKLLELELSLAANTENGNAEQGPGSKRGHAKKKTQKYN